MIDRAAAVTARDNLDRDVRELKGQLDEVKNSLSQSQKQLLSATEEKALLGDKLNHEITEGKRLQEIVATLEKSISFPSFLPHSLIDFVEIVQ